MAMPPDGNMMSWGCYVRYSDSERYGKAWLIMCHVIAELIIAALLSWWRIRFLHTILAVASWRWRRCCGYHALNSDLWWSRLFVAFRLHCARSKIKQARRIHTPHTYTTLYRTSRYTSVYIHTAAGFIRRTHQQDSTAGLINATHQRDAEGLDYCIARRKQKDIVRITYY